MRATTGDPGGRDTRSVKKRIKYTCVVAGEKRMSEFIQEKHDRNLSLKMKALKGLCLMSEETKWSIKCCVCNKRIRTNKKLSYNLTEPISQDTNEGRYLVSILRRHSAKEHPSTPVWNSVPEKRFTTDSKTPRLEFLIHQALRAGGGAGGFVPAELKQTDFLVSFIVRISNSITWFRWNKMAPKRIARLGEELSLGNSAEEHLRMTLKIVYGIIESKQFVDAMSTHSLEQLFNLLMLFFYEMGRYKRCPVFPLSERIDNEVE